MVESYLGSGGNCSQKSPEMVELCQRLTTLYETWGKPEQAARYQDSRQLPNTK